MTTIDPINNGLDEKLSYLKLSYMRQNYESLAKKAAQKQWTHVNYLTELTTAETNLRQDRATKRRIRAARFNQIKTLEQFKWSWPQKINQLQVKNLFRLKFVDEKSNVIFLGGVGLGKTHLATALGYQACLKGHSVLFCSAVDAINNLTAAQSAGRLKQELKKYHKPALVILDELGYLPIDKTGADLLFQIISHRYEQGSLIITTNRVFKDWPEIFNNDSTLTSALLDRLLHHTETVVIEGKSYRMKETIED
jgi:DNA replication protein DnaC